MQKPTRLTTVKNISIVFLAGLLFSACSGDSDPADGNRIEYAFEGLDGHTVTRLYEHEEQLFAATNRGLYTKGANGQWLPIGLMQKEVLDVAILDDEHWIATARVTDAEGATTDQLVESTDGGETWNSIAHDFGAEEPETIFGLYYDANNKALYGTGIDALAMSMDEGRSWELLNGLWGGFGQPKYIVKHNPATNDIWYGGQNGMEQLVLERYSLDNEEAKSFRELMPSPSVVYGIVFDPENDSGVYVSGEGGIIKTENNGTDWDALIGDVDYRFYFDLAIDPQNPEVLYTGGWTKNWDTPQALIFEMSTDGGDTWTQHPHPSTTLFGGVRSILSTTEADETVVYLGLYGGGIMKVTVFDKS